MHSTQEFLRGNPSPGGKTTEAYLKINLTQQQLGETNSIQLYQLQLEEATTPRLCQLQLTSCYNSLTHDIVIPSTTLPP